MSLLLKFNADHVRECIRRIENGEPLPHSGAGWTREDALVVAGVLHFVSISQGPVLHDDVDFDALSQERREAIESQLFSDVEACIRFCSKLTQFVVDDVYDERLHPIVEGVIEGNEDGGACGFTPEPLKRPLGEIE